MNNDRLANPFGRLLRFLDQLEDYNIHPAGVWEIEFFEDGTLEVELFRRAEGVAVVPPAWLDEFIEQNKA